MSHYMGVLRVLFKGFSAPMRAVKSKKKPAWYAGFLSWGANLPAGNFCQGFADVGKRTYRFHTRVFKRCKLLIGSTFAT